MTNLRTILSALHAPGPLSAAALLIVAAVWALLVAVSLRSARSAGPAGPQRPRLPGRGAHRRAPEAASKTAACGAAPAPDLLTAAPAA